MVEKLVQAFSEDLDSVYSMGYDTWGEGSLFSDYLEECRHSIKYQSGMWYALNVDGVNVSSCIVYQLYTNVVGIGSLATKTDKRGLGFGSNLIKKILSLNIGSVYFLWSDIDPVFIKIRICTN
ncbi:GNAT family N-acetyltransferase [Enterococcus sp. OL5]|uniref:GNAT family N-acetyltransferase n=1 Tax=Enterococcus sp. OL5 TaxID=2590214 RepID=UPI00112BB45B|nr:GNAT family N-acetyltransferase [Enterococcus sp. OL5]TPR56912.1 N-acetyltransferase [Enterococcus sp. OL5]